MDNSIWPPDFDTEIKRRELIIKVINSTDDPKLTAKEFYSNNPIRFIKDNCITYDPRNPAKGLPAKMPFIPFKRQIELVDWLQKRISEESGGLVEKSRDMGATWICAAFSVWMWLFVDGSSVGFGSRKELLVDRLGDPDSIFEKIRMIFRSLPWYFLPDEFVEKEHLTFMKCINAENSSTISGEAGDNIGRGGRKSIYFKDEAAHYERAELVEASLGDNTNVQIDISSVNGEGNVFHRKRMGGSVDVFIFDWRDHPGKTQEWYNKRKDKAEAEGLLSVFAQEVDRDYSSAVEGILIPSKYVKAALDAHIKLGIKPIGKKVAGLDVADEGGDKNALICVHGQVLTHIDMWGEGTTDYTAKKAYEHVSTNNIDELLYDSIGVGAGIKGTLSAMSENKPLSVKVIGFSAGGAVVNPDKMYTDGKKNSDMFANVKAQAWWALRDRLVKTYQAVVEGKDIDPSEILSIPSNLPYAQDLVSELSRPKQKYDTVGRILVEKKADMKKRGLPSPNLADALIMCFAPTKAKMKVHFG